MNYFKAVEGDFITAIFTDHGPTEITKAEYDRILDAIHTMPSNAPAGYSYRLKTDLTWELYGLPSDDEAESDEPTA